MDTMNIHQIMGFMTMLLLAGFGGGVTSLLVAFVNKPNFPNAAKQAIAFLSCIVMAFGSVLILQIDYTNLYVLIPALLIGCYGSYVRVWKPTGIAPWIETLFMQGKADAK